MRLILGKITIFVHSVALDRLQSLHLYCWWTSNVETLFHWFFNQFLILDITHRGSPGGHWGHFRGKFDQKFRFLAVWSCYMSVNPFTWSDDPYWNPSGKDLFEGIFWALVGQVLSKWFTSMKNVGWKSLSCPWPTWFLKSDPKRLQWPLSGSHSVSKTN